jgi:Zn finger protein HypA/HybF (possibly regulating hydrogenase expression)
VHEVAVMSDIIKAAVAELEKHDVIRVEELVILIGDLTSLGEDQLQFAYEVMTKNTILENSVLVVEHEEVMIRCTKCNYGGKAETLKNDCHEHTVPILACPKCSASVTITKGQACAIRSIKIQEE